MFPVVLPSTLDSAFDLTISNASSSDYTLGLMSIVAAVRPAPGDRLPGLDLLGVPPPGQCRHIPEAHSFLPAIAARAFTTKG